MMTAPKPTDAKMINNTAASPSHRDNSFREFRRICADIANVSAYTDKTSVVRKMLEKGSDGGK